MKKSILLAVVFISGCFDDTADLRAHIASVQKDTTSYIAPIPEALEFIHFDYSVQSLRSPFVVPKPEAIQEKLQQLSGCLSPDPDRIKQPLEKFSLSDLTMRGTLGELDVIWALIEASDASLHRVSVGNHLGLFNGRITSVSQESVKVTELIPDGAGCWAERETIVTMIESD